METGAGPGPLGEAFLAAIGGNRKPAVVHEAWRNDPIGWAVKHLGVSRRSLVWSNNPEYEGHIWDGCQDPFVKASQALVDSQDVGIESATGTGKSYWAAIIILWFLACWQDSRVFTFAPKEDQLELYIWAEVQRLWPRFKRWFPEARLMHLVIKMQEGNDMWGAWGYPVGLKAGQDVAVSAAGMHAEHMLLVYEEMPGIPQPVVEAGFNTAIAPHNLRLGIGNPDHQLDTLHRFCQLRTTTKIRISAYDHPNVVSGDSSRIPGAVSTPSIEKRKAGYGEDTPMFQRRIRGLSPEQAEDSLIRREWLVRSAVRYAERQKEKKPVERNPFFQSLGIDVAQSDNGDKAALAQFDENVLTFYEAKRCPNATNLGREAYARILADKVPMAHVGVDPVGVGAATLNFLREQEDGALVWSLAGNLRPFIGTERGDGAEEWIVDSNSFLNLRAQVAWQLREDFRRDRIDVPEDPVLWEELLAPTYTPVGGKIRLERKEDIKERLNGRSPNLFDAVMYANWTRPRKLPVPKVEGPTIDKGDIAGFRANREEIDPRKPFWKQHRPGDTTGMVEV